LTRKRGCISETASELEDVESFPGKRLAELERAASD
jgi:hypothetical protein